MGGLRIDDEDVTITRPGQNAVPYEVTQSQIRTRFQEDDQPRVERNQGEEKQEKKKTGRGKNRFSLFVAPRHSDDEDADEVPERREIRAAATTTKTKLPESAYLFQNDKAHHYENENVYEEHDTDLAALDRIDGPGHAHGHAHGQEQAHEHDKDRDARLRECLFELKKMNSVFDTFLDALENARGHNEVSWLGIFELHRTLFFLHFSFRLFVFLSLPAFCCALFFCSVSSIHLSSFPLTGEFGFQQGRSMARKGFSLDPDLPD